MPLVSWPATKSVISSERKASSLMPVYLCVCVWVCVCECVCIFLALHAWQHLHAASKSASMSQQAKTYMYTKNRFQDWLIEKKNNLSLSNHSQTHTTWTRLKENEKKIPCGQCRRSPHHLRGKQIHSGTKHCKASSLEPEGTRDKKDRGSWRTRLSSSLLTSKTFKRACKNKAAPH